MFHVNTAIQNAHHMIFDPMVYESGMRRPLPKKCEHHLQNLLNTLWTSQPKWKRQETGRLIELLAENEHGLSKSELATLFYSDYQNASELRQSALIVCLNKLLQRARRRLSPYGLELQFQGQSSRWVLKPSVGA